MRSILWVAIALASSPTLHAATPYATDARPLTLRLAEGGSRGEWLQPRGAAPRSVVVLLHGSDVSDLDGAQVDGAGTVVSRPLRQIAESLACARHASLRYDKRHVTVRPACSVPGTTHSTCATSLPMPWQSSARHARKTLARRWS